MADRDLLRVYHDLPITSFSGWDKVWQIESVLGVHDRGTFRESAMLCDSMMRDDRIAAVSDTRVSALISSPVECKAANPRAKAAKIAKEIGGDGDFPGLWSQMFPASVIGELSWWGNWLGFGIAQVLWDTTGTGNVPSTAWSYMTPNGKMANGSVRPDGYLPPDMSQPYKPTKPGRWTPHLKVWHPQYVYWDWSSYRYVAICAEGAVTLPNTDEQTHSDGKWFIWAPHGYQYGWLKAMVRRVAHKYIMRGWDYRDWARYNERHGMPILGAITPANANAQLKQDFKDALSRMGSDAVIPLPQGGDPKDGNNYDLKVIEAVARTYLSFQLFKKELDDDIAITFLGQNLTTDSQGGSMALAQIQDKVRIDKRIEDAGIDVAIRNQVLWWDAGYNYGDPELAPIPQHQVEPPEDEAEEAKTLLALGQGLQAMELGAPGLLDIRGIVDRFGYPMLSEEEQAALQEEKQQKALEQQQAMIEAGGGPAKPGDDKKDDKGDDKAKGGNPFASKKPAALTAVPAQIAKQIVFQGMPISVENPAGSERHWTDHEGRMGVTVMQYDYGFFDGINGADKDELDVYVGPDENAPDVHVVRQHDKADPTKYDEDKVFVGFADAGAAKAAYLAHRDDGDVCFGGMSTIPLARFKARIARRPAGATSPIRTRTDTTAAIVALVKRIAEGRPVSQLRSKQGAARAKRYPDTLQDNGVRRAAALLANDVKGIVADIQSASGYDDLREKVLARYRDKMQPDELAELLRKVNLMAHMAGRYTATGGR
jgi:phage gp29-like protein